jgi:hypothetical protein
MRFSTTAPDVIAYSLDASKQPNGTKRIFVIHNAKFEQKWLWWHYRLRLWPIFCTFRSSAIIYNGKKGLRHDLNSVITRELNEFPRTSDQSDSNWGGVLTQEQKDYAAEDVLRLIRLRLTLRAKLAEYGLLTTALVEFGVVLAECRTELNGLPVHGGRWRALAEANEVERARLREELLFELPHPTGQLALPGMGAGWNVDSPQQMLASLKRLGLKVENTRLKAKIKSLRNVLGPTVPKNLPVGPDAEWAEALRILSEEARG